MAKNLKFVIDGQSWEAAITKVDRDKVYGYVEEVVTDHDGHPCSIGNLLDDGQTLILSGATALKTVDDTLHEVDKKTLKPVYMDGSDAVLVPSSYDGDIPLQKCSLDDLFNLEVTAVYQLSWEDATAKAGLLKQLENAAVFRFVFNYRADYEGADAILMAAQNEVFILTGRLLEFEYLGNQVVMPVEEAVDNPSEEEDMDFGML